MNLKHKQFDPTINRTRRAEGGPAAPERKSLGIAQPPADPENPYQMTHLGLFDGKITDEAGEERKFVFYIPTTMKTSGSSMLVFIPGGMDPEEFFHKYNWKESLEKHEITTYFFSAENGWKLDDPGFEIDAATKVLSEMRSMEYFPCNGPAVYCMGFGDGANIASVFSVMHVSMLAAWAAWGDTNLEEELMELISNAPSDCDSGLKKSDVSLPSFIIDNSESNTLTFFKRACKVKEEYLYNGFSRVFRQQPKPGESYINDQACSEVWHASEEEMKKLGDAEAVEKMVAFVDGYKRWGGEGNSYVRRTQRPEDIGMIKTEMVIDGLKRFWYTFEPSAYKRGLKEKYPLVIAIHGFSCSGEFFAENSWWHAVGEERGAIIVYPNAYPFERSQDAGRFGKNIAATPSWNTGRMSLEMDPNGPDEISFFKQMVAYVEKMYPIDPERIYVTGHSNGSRMTQRIMRYWPEKFAAFAPVGAMEATTEAIIAPDSDYRRAVWYTMGEFDLTGCTLEEGSVNRRTVDNLCQANGLDFKNRRYYETGIYMNTLIKDAEGTPLVRFTGVKNWPHTYSPELSFMIYDDYFAKFARHEDGSLEYFG